MKSAMRGKKIMINECSHQHNKWEIVSWCVILPPVVDLASSVLSGKTKFIWLLQERGREAQCTM